MLHNDTRIREAADGSIIFVHRGKAPECPEGYLPDPQDAWRFIPDIDPCEYRTLKDRKADCSGCGKSLFCTNLNMPITLYSCEACDEEWLAEQRQAFGLEPEPSIQDEEQGIEILDSDSDSASDSETAF